jgi:hypothetical protein
MYREIKKNIGRAQPRDVLLTLARLRAAGLALCDKKTIEHEQRVVPIRRLITRTNAE